MVLLNFITKGINKTIAPKFLRWSLRIHESLPASSIIPTNAFSLLPLAQRLVSIEAQDDYRQLRFGSNAQDGFLIQASNSFDEFVERAWNVLGLEKLAAEKEKQTKPARTELVAETKPMTRLERRRDKNHTSLNRKSANHEELLQQGRQRVHLLEKYLLPAFAKSSISDPPQTFVKWIRGEYLIAKYGLLVQDAIRKHPELRDDAAGLSTFGAKTLDGKEAEFPLDSILPTVKIVRNAFYMEDWSIAKAPLASWKNGDEYATAGDFGEMTIDTIIHNRLQGQIAFSGPINAYFEMRRREDSYELWTKDYIFGLANYLLQRIEEMNEQSACELETTILDVGAGDGRLIYFLRRAMKEIASSKRKIGDRRNATMSDSSMPTLIATDDGSWRAPIYNNSHIQVEQLSAADAVEKYGPKPEFDNKRLIVLCSWMPPGEDWTFLFRQPAAEMLMQSNEASAEHSGLVEEYILVGECDDGTCGHNWYTWGNNDFYPAVEADNNTPEMPPHIVDGYIRVDLEELSQLQFSRFDCSRSSESKTVSFRRGN